MKKRITKALIIVISLIMLFTLLVNYMLRIHIIQNSVEKKSEEIFGQIENLIQYAAVWREDGRGIIQAGLEPGQALGTMERSIFSSVFSLIATDSGTVLYAVDPESHEIISCTVPQYTGKNAEELGLELEGHSENISITHPVIDGKKNYCAFRDSDSLILVRTYLQSALNKQVLMDTGLLAMDIVILSAFAIIFLYFYLDRKIVKGIISINEKLYQIEQGGSGILFHENAVPELAELSIHINGMLKSVLSSAKKISIALELSQIPIGIYEYTPGSKRVMATSRVREMLMLTDEEVNELLEHPELIPEKEAELKRNAVQHSVNVYKLSRGEERYIRFEEFTYEESRLAILIDVTREVLEKHHIEQERDMDPLTGIFNRRAFYARMDEIFIPGAKLEHGVIIIIDADKLKQTNDLYGHKNGDIYLKRIAEVISVYHNSNAVAARFGGDEFVLCLYGCASREELDHIVEKIAAQQDRHKVKLEDGIEITVHFSMGYAFYTEDGCDYRSLMKIADQRMYRNKKERNSP